MSVDDGEMRARGRGCPVVRWGKKERDRGIKRTLNVVTTRECLHGGERERESKRLTDSRRKSEGESSLSVD